MRSLVQRLQCIVQGRQFLGRLHLGDVHRALVALRLVAFTGQPGFPFSASFRSSQRQWFPKRLEVCIGFLESLYLRSKVFWRHLFHAQEQFSQSGADHFVPVFPQLVEKAASIRRVELDVLT